MKDEDKGAIVAATGAAVGGASAIGTIAAAGAVTGLSAAGVTSGLAAVGSVIGGGMVAGLAVTAAAPLAVGAAAYGLFKWLKD
jgi:hypothetical protein